MTIRTISLLIMLMFTAFSCNKGSRIIINPETDSNNTNGSLFISSIELADTATIVYFDSYMRAGNWFRISSETTLVGSSERVYNIISCEGITLDKKEYAPESGHTPFAIFFEPLTSVEKIVNFKEGDNDGDYRITGIKLYKVKQPAKNLQCILKGKVIDRPNSNILVLSKKREDTRTAKVVYIPIKAGEFEYVLNCDYPQEYELAFQDELLNGAWHPVSFISEQSTIYFTLFPMDKHSQNNIEGSDLNTEYREIEAKLTEYIEPLYKSLNEKQEALMSNNKYFTPEAAAIRNQIDESYKEGNREKAQSFQEKFNKIREAGKDLTPDAVALQKEAEIIKEKFSLLKEQYVNEHLSIVGYGLLVQSAWENVHYTKTDIASFVDLYNKVYSQKFPDHPYTEEMNRIIVGASNIKLGGSFIDFTAPDLKGSLVTLSEQIKDKIALIHLWASWCGPCRKHGKEMIPLYEAYKDQGFTVVGIAREYDSSAAEAAVKLDGYKWLNLVEVNDKEMIWTKYGLGNAGGGDFLVDKNGVILAVNPSAEEVESILKKLLL